MFQKGLRGVSVTSKLTECLKEAIESNALNEDQKSILKDHQIDDCYPISIIQILKEWNESKLEEALKGSQLLYTQPPKQELSEEQKRFRDRINKLKLKQEEYKYTKITKNIGNITKQDDVTTRSMTYAASIGLNMIIAPLSFGCFMYFFGGSLLDYLIGKPQQKSPNGTDIRRVIVGVISGVIMLFIEMILFVIRTHELEKAIRKKEKKSKNTPFGYYTANTRKTFKDD